MQHLRIAVLSLLLGSALGACEETPKGAETQNQVVDAWKAADVGAVELATASDSEALAGGDCLHGKVAGLYVDLCKYKDALAADSAREQGLEKIGAITGAALVRDRYVLVVADNDKVDVHGKVLNKVAKTFLKP